MARRKQSTMDDLIEVTSYFHWGAGVSLAIVSYLSLHWYVGLEPPVVKDMSDLSSNMASQLFRGLATIGQYILPVIFLLGAVTSLFNRTKRHNLYEKTKNSKSSNPLEEMSWLDFELLIGEHFRRQGFSVRETAGGADGGVDLILKKDGSTYFVQCKQWKAYKVGVKVVRELLGVMVSAGAAGAYVITSGQFTKDAVGFAGKNNIQLIDGGKLKSIISNTPPSLQAPLPKTETLCPKCGRKMVGRVAKKGSRAGEQFWGCSKFPNCRGTLPYSR